MSYLAVISKVLLMLCIKLMFYTLKTILGCFKKDFYNFIQFFSILTDFGNRKGSTSFTLNKTYKFIIIKKFIENYVNHP